MEKLNDEKLGCYFCDLKAIDYAWDYYACKFVPCCVYHLEEHKNVIEPSDSLKEAIQ